MSKYSKMTGDQLLYELKEYKAEKNLTNKALAEELDVTPVTLGRWLNGKAKPDPGSERKIEDLLVKSILNKPLGEVSEDTSEQIELDMEGDSTEDTEEVVESTTETSSEEKNYEPNTWSVSRVKTWLDNPWDFYCKYVMGLDKASPWQDALDRGTVLHRVLELLATSPLNIDQIEEHIRVVNTATLSYNTLIEEGKKKIPPHLRAVLIKNITEAEQAIKELKPIKALSEKGVDDGIRVARKYLDEYGGVDNMGEVLECEKKLEWDMDEYLPNQSFVGYVDKVIKDERGRIWLVDHKTYSNKPQFDNLRMELQANVYMWVMTNVYDVEVAGFIYDCINPKEKIVGKGYHFHQFKIPYNERIVDMVMENFMTTIEIILDNPDYNVFKVSEYGTAYMNELLHGFDGQFTPNITGIEEDDE